MTSTVPPTHMPAMAAVDRWVPASLLLLLLCEAALVLVGSVGVDGDGSSDGVAVSMAVPELPPAVGSAVLVALAAADSVGSEVGLVPIWVRLVVDVGAGSSPGGAASSGQPPRSQAGSEQQPRNPLPQL